MPSLNLLKVISKKNKKRILTALGLILISLAEHMFTYIGKEVKLLHDTKEESRLNTMQIQNLDQSITRNSLVLKDVVTRKSFNAYIAHTDDRFKYLNDANSHVTKNIGFLNGKVSGLEKIIYALNLYEIQKTK